MPKFTIQFEREVTCHDQVTRVVEADTLEDAMEKAQGACSAFNGDCPEDAQQVGEDDCQGWYVRDYQPAAADAEVDELPDDSD